MATLAQAPGAAAAPRVVDGQRRIAQALLVVACAALVLFLLAPLTAILVKSVEDRNGAFVGFTQFRDYLTSPALVESLLNTLFVAAIVTAVTVPLAFTFA